MSARRASGMKRTSISSMACAALSSRAQERGKKSI